MRGMKKKPFKRPPSEFERAVYDAVRGVPKGCVATYRAVAERVGCRSCRAVGQALKRNPFSPAVPCHRIIASDFSIGGFMGCADGRAVARKAGMLAREGIVFVRGRLADRRRLHVFTDE